MIIKPFKSVIKALEYSVKIRPEVSEIHLFKKNSQWVLAYSLKH